MNYAYVGVLSTDNYLLGVLGVQECLKRVNSAYPFYVLITDKISTKTEKYLNSCGIKTIRKKSIDIPNEIKEKNAQGDFSHWTYTFDKLSIFELTQFDKIVYLDADIYIRKSVDSLFDFPNMSAPCNYKFGPNVTVPHELVSGLFVIEPQEGLIQEFLNILPEVAKEKASIGDQDILQKYYSNWTNEPEKHLELKYTVFFTYLDYYINHQHYNLDDLYLFHFILTKKPWDFETSALDDYIKYLSDRVETLYGRYQSQELLDCIKCGNENKRTIAKEYMELLDYCREKYAFNDFKKSTSKNSEV